MRSLIFALVATLGASNCIGVSQKRLVKDSAGIEVKTCRVGVRPALDGDVDDFEAESKQIAQIAGRDGYWWTKNDPSGSTIGPSPFIPSDGGADGSQLALRAVGHTASCNPVQCWGAGFGANLLSRKGAAYDASKYVGITFKAKVGPNSTRLVRFKVGDINTHPDAKVCTSCWNHFGKDLTLTTEWKEYRILFSELSQEPGWGNPRPTALTPSKLVAIDWSFAGGGQDYDIWVDNIRLLDCL